MKQELVPLITELCYIAVLRNNINTRRHRARYRKNYYAHAVRVVEAHNKSNYELRSLRRQFNHLTENTGFALALRSVDLVEIDQIKKRISDIETGMSWLVKENPISKKWKSMGLHKLRSLVLQGTGEYATAKHETMEFSMKHRTRVKQLTIALQCSLSYENGSVTAIRYKGGSDALYLEEIHHYAEQHELNKAVESMIKEL